MSKDDSRLEHLESIQAMNEATDQIVAGARMVTIGGVEGIREAAESDPELIIEVITTLAAVIERQQESFVKLNEAWYESMDQVDGLIAITQKK